MLKAHVPTGKMMHFHATRHVPVAKMACFYGQENMFPLLKRHVSVAKRACSHSSKPGSNLAYNNGGSETKSTKGIRNIKSVKGQVIPLQARCGPEGG